MPLFLTFLKHIFTPQPRHDSTLQSTPTAEKLAADAALVAAHPETAVPRFKVNEETVAAIAAQLDRDAPVHLQIIGNQSAQHTGQVLYEMLVEEGFHVSTPHRVGTHGVRQDQALVIHHNTISLDPEK